MNPPSLNDLRGSALVSTVRAIFAPCPHIGRSAHDARHIRALICNSSCMGRRIRTHPFIGIGAALSMLSVLVDLQQPGEPWVSIALSASVVGLVLIITGVVRDIRRGAWSRQ